MSRTRTRLVATVGLVGGLVAATPAIGLASTPDGTAAGDAPKLAIVYSAEWQDGSWGRVRLRRRQRRCSTRASSPRSCCRRTCSPAPTPRTRCGRWPTTASTRSSPTRSTTATTSRPSPRTIPETIFVYAGGFGDVAGNVGDYSQPFYEPAYLEGILAAGVTVEGKVAGAGGFDIPVCRAMNNAFLAGAQEIDPDTTATSSPSATGTTCSSPRRRRSRPGRRRRQHVHRLRPGPDVRPDRGGQRDRRRVDGLRRRHVRASARRCWPRSPGTSKAVFQLMVDDVVAGKTEAQYYEVPMKDGGMESSSARTGRTRSPPRRWRCSTSSWRQIESGHVRGARTTTRADP